MIDRTGRRRKRWTLVATVTMAIVGASIEAGCGSETATTSTTAASTSGAMTTNARTELLPPAAFKRLPGGWKAFDDGGASLTSRGGTTESYATSWAFDPSSGNGPAGDLPADGVIVNVLLLRRSAGGRARASLCGGVAASRAYPPLEPPLSLSDMKRGHLEGVPDAAEYRLLRTQADRDYRMEIRVDVAPHGSRAAAQHALDAVRLPKWGNRC